MQDIITVTGIVLKHSPIGEYDRHVCILTKERGKIQTIASGSRRPGNKLTARTNPFTFGTFKLSEGNGKYKVLDVEVSNYFDAFRRDFTGTCYGMYFTEIADYYTRENNDEVQMMKLLYQSLRALCAESIPNPLIKCIYEIKAIAVNGEFPGIPTEKALLPATDYAIQYIVNSPVEKVYSFNVNDEVLAELKTMSDYYMKRCVGHNFKSLEVLQTLC